MSLSQCLFVPGHILIPVFVEQQINDLEISWVRDLYSFFLSKTFFHTRLYRFLVVRASGGQSFVSLRHCYAAPCTLTKS